MHDCDYCEASFEDQEPYLAHLAEDHEGELGPIEQRRVGDLADDDGGLPTGPLLLAGLILSALALVAYILTIAGGGGSGVAGDLPSRGDDAVISQVQTEPAESTAHVDQVSASTYDRLPPTGGPHYSGTVSAGFYESEQSLGATVHTLEHGAIVVWYDPAAISPDAEEHMRTYAGRYTGGWASFVAVPTPVEDPESPYVLTAWEKRLTMDEYDRETVRAFTAEYIGRGPENAVR